MSQKPNAESLFATAGGTAANTSIGTLLIIPPLTTAFIEGVYARPVVSGAANSTIVISDSASAGTAVDASLNVACNGTAGVLVECTAKGRAIRNASSTLSQKLIVCTGGTAPGQIVDVIVKYALIPL
jgi:hypothetical protein